MLAVKDILVKYLASLYSVSFLLFFTSFQLEGKLPDVYIYALRVSGILFLAYTFFENLKLVKLIRRLESKAYIDPLTGVHNRKYLEEVFRFEIEKFKRIGKPFCMLFLDLNNFKYINDKYGHAEGDKILRKIAQAIKENVRKSDFVIRYGGDEFIILTDAGPEEILKLIERLNNALRFTYKDIEISVSIGSSCYPSDGKTLEELIKVADERMYKIKKLQKKLLQADKR
ncbi:GGDEF domain-containing protein [Aquifex pyrophilus]